MHKKSKVQPKPLQTINQNPGNQESFVVYSDSTQTMPQNFDAQSNSLPIPKPNSKQLQAKSQQSSKELQNKPQQNRPKKKKKKTRLQPQRPKINMSSRALEQDLKLLQEQNEITTNQILYELKEQHTPEDQIQIILKIINQTHKRTLDKITRNLKILPAIYSEQIVPVQISLTGQTKKLNQLTQDNLKLAHARVKAQKSVSKNIKIFPKIPPGCDIILNDGSAMTADDYIKEKGENPEIVKAKENVRELEVHLNLTQKKFLDTIELHNMTNKDLEEDLNGMKQSEKSVKKKNENRR